MDTTHRQALTAMPLISRHRIPRLLVPLALSWCVSLLPLSAQDPPPAEAEDTAQWKVGDIQPQLDRWNAFFRETVGQPDAVKRLEGYRKEHGVPLSFWGPDDETSRVPPYFGGDHPCGTSAILFVDKVPGKDQPIQGDEVFELDGTGKIIGTWMVPIDTEVAGIEGEQILVPSSFEPVAVESDGLPPAVETLLSVRRDGTFNVVAPRSALPEPAGFSCPSTLEESAYWFCGTFRDLATKKERRLAFQWPCT